MRVIALPQVVGSGLSGAEERPAWQTGTPAGEKGGQCGDSGPSLGYILGALSKCHRITLKTGLQKSI